LERLRLQQPIVDRLHKMAAQAKQIVCESVQREKALSFGSNPTKGRKVAWEFSQLIDSGNIVTLFELPFFAPLGWGSKNGSEQLVNFSIKAREAVKVCATFNPFVGLDPT